MLSRTRPEEAVQDFSSLKLTATTKKRKGKEKKKGKKWKGKGEKEKEREEEEGKKVEKGQWTKSCIFEIQCL